MINKIIQILQEHPRTNKDLPHRISPCRMSIENRGRIRQIRVAGNRSKKPGRGWFKTVYYLEGDEDRAITLFADVNAETLAGLNFRRNTIIDSGLTREMARKIRAAIR